MAATPLRERLRAAGARIGEFAGAETALSFGDAECEYRALTEECAVFDLGWRAKIVATGEDRVRWLNGMVTNNVRDLAPNCGVYSFLLNAQGRILGDMYLFNRGDYVLLDTDREQAPKLRESFEKFIIMDDVELADASEKLTAIGLRGPKLKDVLVKAGIAAPSLQPLEVADLAWREMGISLVAGEQANEYEIWVAPANATAAWDALLEAGATPVGTEALEMARVAAGIPRYGVDIRERDLPQETEQYRALNFSKGCYVGQEIVERIRSRGQVHRLFTRFEVVGKVAPGTKIQVGGKDVGEITSVASLPGGRRVALGYARREALGGEMTAGEARLRVQELSKLTA
jgi:folate-binding protein YgfZ